MKRLHRLRNAMKWIFTVLTVLLLIAWMGNQWIAISSDSPLHRLVATDGFLTLYLGDTGTPYRFDVFWLNDEEWPTGEFSLVISLFSLDIWLSSPLWFLALISLIPAAWMWYGSFRGKQPGQCANCHYDLRGTDHAVCPECGTAVAKPITS